MTEEIELQNGVSTAYIRSTEIKCPQPYQEFVVYALGRMIKGFILLGQDNHIYIFDTSIAWTVGQQPLDVLTL